MYKPGYIHVDKKMLEIYANNYELPIDIKAFLKDIFIFQENNKITIELR